MANEHGGNDNVTVVVLDVLVGEAAADGAASRPGVPVAVATSENQGSGGGAAAASAVTPPPGAKAVTPMPAGDGRAPAADGSRRRSLLGRFEAVPGFRGVTRRAEDVQARLRSRRITLRVLLFLVVLAGLAAGAVAVVRWYVDSSYFVQMHRGQVVVYQGRLGGFLGMNPHPVWHTGVPADQIVEQPKLQQLNHGVEEPSLRAACNYVVNLTQEEAALQRAAAASTTTAPTTTAAPTTTTAPPPPGASTSAPPATVPPATTTTLALPKGCRR
jgi:hypothetical protein